jgi:quercetin dioxygenase-like cupin family protein
MNKHVMPGTDFRPLEPLAGIGYGDPKGSAGSGAERVDTMATSASWTLFDMAEVPTIPIRDREGLTGQALVDNTDPEGSTLLAIHYEAGAGDNSRCNSVGQVHLVISGEVRINGRRCGRGAGCFVPAAEPYAIEASADGAVVVEFRPAPIFYGSDADDDDATVTPKAPTAPDPAYAWDVMQSAGPVTSTDALSYFDIFHMPESPVSTDLWIQALVNHAEDNGQSILMVRHGPDSVTPMHSHDVDQIVFVLEGSVNQGARSFGPGTGFFTPAGKRYMLRAGDEGTVRVEWRPSPLRFSTDWAESAKP